MAFWYMDRYWYHKLLLGSVKQGTFIENQYSHLLPEMGLTKAIGDSSPQKIFKWKIHSSNKYWIFYGLLFLPLLILTAILFWGHERRISLIKPKMEQLKLKNMQSRDSINAITQKTIVLKSISKTPFFSQI